MKVSTKHQIAVPSEARHQLGIQAGDRLDVTVSDDAIVLRKRPRRASDRLRGLASGTRTYEPDPDTYLRRLRDEWEDHALERRTRLGTDDAGTTRAGGDRRQPFDLPA